LHFVLFSFWLTFNLVKRTPDVVIPRDDSFDRISHKVDVDRRWKAQIDFRKIQEILVLQKCASLWNRIHFGQFSKFSDLKWFENISVASNVKECFGFKWSFFVIMKNLFYENNLKLSIREIDKIVSFLVWKSEKWKKNIVLVIQSFS
jgi:hypothetical protein